MSENVVDFKSKQAEKATQEETLTLPKEVEDRLKNVGEWTQEMVELIDKALVDYAKQYEDRRDISIPLEALGHVIGHTSAELDMQIEDEKTLQDHVKLRAELANELNKTISSFSNVSNLPVYSHDIYIALTYVLVSYIQQHRVFTFMREHEGSEVADEQNNNQGE